jgi:hypothetical protein
MEASSSGAKHRSPRSLARRSMLEKREKFFPISTLFFEVKRGFIDPRKIVPLQSRVEISPFFSQGVLSPKNIFKASNSF